MTRKLPLKKSLAQFTDRELLEVLFANQLVIYRKVVDLEDQVRDEKIEGHGPYENTIHDLLNEADEILHQADSYLGRSDASKESRPYGE